MSEAEFTRMAIEQRIAPMLVKYPTLIQEQITGTPLLNRSGSSDLASVEHVADIAARRCLGQVDAGRQGDLQLLRVPADPVQLLRAYANRSLSRPLRDLRPNRFLAAACLVGAAIQSYGSLGVPVAVTAIVFVLGLILLPFAVETRGRALPT